MKYIGKIESTNYIYFIWLLSTEDNDVCRKIARFINLSFCLEQNLKCTIRQFIYLYVHIGTYM